ncbi:hypothetical protein FRB90_011691, partial [Tulasnella sp. 427]
NIGKWVLTNIFAGFVRVELNTVQQVASASNPIVEAGFTPTSAVTPAPNPVSIVRGAAPTHISLAAPSEGRRLRSASELSNVVRTPGHHALGRPARTPAILIDLPPPGTRTASSSSGQVTPVKNTAGQHVMGLNKLSALTPIPASPTATATTPGASTTVARTPSTTTGKDAPDYFTNVKGRARSGSVANESSQDEGANTTTPGGFMGRLRNFGKSSKRPASADATVAAIPENADVAPAQDQDVGSSLRVQHLKALNAILSQSLAPTPSLEAPPLQLPPDTAVMISEETADAGGWTGIYTSVIANLQDDVESFEMAAPIWLLELLLLNKAPAVPPTKLSFVVVQYERRSEPISDSSRLTAGRNLRVRKVLQYVKDKLEPLDLAKGKDATKGPAAASLSQTSLSTSQDVKPEELYELLCNDTVLPLTMTIGAVRHYVWRQSGELLMYYRRKNPSVPQSSKS